MEDDILTTPFSSCDGPTMIPQHEKTSEDERLIEEVTKKIEEVRAAMLKQKKYCKQLED